MSAAGSPRVGSALVWKATQVGADRAISLVRFLVLARLLAPTDFGLLAVGTVALDLLMTVTALGMMEALVQRKELEDRHYHAAWTVNVLRGVAVAVVVFASAPLIAQLFDEPRAVPILRLIALRPLLSGFLSIRTADLRRQLDFRRLAMVEVPPGIAQTVVSIALAPVIGVYALIAGLLVHAASHVVLSYRVCPYRPRFHMGGEATRALVRYGRWILATSIVAVAGDSLLRVVISRDLGTVDLGLFYLAARLVELPGAVIGLVLRSVAFPLHAQLQDAAEGAAEAFRANVRALLVALLPVSVGIAALAEPLVRDVLGSQWRGAVGIIRILAVATAITVVRWAVGPLLEGRGVPQHATAMDAVRSCVLLLTVWPLTARFGLLGAGVAVLLSELAVQILAARLARQLLPEPFGGLWPAASVALLASGAAAGVALAVDAMLGPPLGLLASASAALVVGTLLLMALDHMLDVGLLRQLAATFPVLRRVPLLRRLVVDP